MSTQNCREGLTLEKCNVIKTFMMILVILGHSMVWLNGGWVIEPAEKSVAFGAIAVYLNTIHIYVFSFISGYIFYYLKFETQKYNNINCIVNRLKRLIIPYFTVSLFWAIPINIYFNGFDYTEIINNYVLAVNPDQLWFLWMIFIVFVVFFLFSNFINKNHFLLNCFIIGIIYVLSMALNRYIPNYFQIWTACRHMIFYYLGFAMRKYEWKFLYKIPRFFYVATNVIICSIYIYAKYTRNFETIAAKIMFIGLGMLCSFSGVFMVVVILGGFELNKIQSNKLYSFLQKNNFGMYLFHQQVIYFTITLFDGKVPVIGTVFFNFLISASVSALITWILNKWDITKSIIGIKS